MVNGRKGTAFADVDVGGYALAEGDFFFFLRNSRLWLKGSKRANV